MSITRKTINEIEAQHTPPHNRRLMLIMDDVRSMHNIGAAFRTADAFGAEEILLCGYTPCPPHRDIHKTALGAEDTVRWQQFETVTDAIAYAKGKGFQIAAIEQAAPSKRLSQAADVQPTAFVFGNEVTGVSDEAFALADYCIEIPQWGDKHSLNVSVCVGIVLWEFVR